MLNRKAMKKVKSIVLLLASVLLIGSCQKEPTANFTTDKETYTAGETVHCKDASTNAHSWKWTMPDGKIYTTQNVDYTIDSNDLGGKKVFTIEVESKNGKKAGITLKSIRVKQYILPSDYFAVGSTSHKPDSITCNSNGNNWVINAYRGLTGYSNFHYDYMYILTYII